MDNNKNIDEKKSKKKRAQKTDAVSDFFEYIIEIDAKITENIQ